MEVSFASEDEENTTCNIYCENEEKNASQTINLSDSSETGSNVSLERSTPNKVGLKLEITPKKVLSPKLLQRKIESEKKRHEKQREKEDKEKKRNDEKMKRKEEKQKEFEQKQKEKELRETQKKEEREKREEQKRKEREEKEQKRKEKEEKEEQKRKERELEKNKKLQEIEEKNKEKQKEEEKKQKAAAAFVNFFVSKKIDNIPEKKTDEAIPSLFMAFEVKSDMRLPPLRRKPLSSKELTNLDMHLQQQIDESIIYLAELKSGKNVGTCTKTWSYQEALDDDVTIIEEGSNLGETICGDSSKLQKFRTKFFKFHENRRPAYYGTWRKRSQFITARKPFAEDKDTFNYEEDSDDDWEEEEQGESLNGSDDEEKDNEEERDEYEVDNDFFVPHGHLSDDEIDDEEKARLSPESLKQKLKLLKDEFEQDMQSKTHKLKSRSIGCIWYNKDGSNVAEAIDRYLQPLAIITNGPIQIKKRNEIFLVGTVRRNKQMPELNPDHIPSFLKVIHGNSNRKLVIVEQFLSFMADKGTTIDLKKGTLMRALKQFASWKQTKEKGSSKNKFCWLVNEDVEKKFNVDLVLPNFLESDTKK